MEVYAEKGYVMIILKPPLIESIVFTPGWPIDAGYKITIAALLEAGRRDLINYIFHFTDRYNPNLPHLSNYIHPQDRTLLNLALIEKAMAMGYKFEKSPYECSYCEKNFRKNFGESGVTHARDLNRI